MITCRVVAADDVSPDRPRAWDRHSKCAVAGRAPGVVVRPLECIARADLQKSLPKVDDSSVNGLTVKRWKRYGHDRLYVSTAEKQTVGYLDLQTGAMHLDMPALAQPFDVALAEHFGIAERPIPRQAEPVAPLVPSFAVPCEDLARRTPGQQAGRAAESLRRQAPVTTALARLFGVPTDERSWRVGADGERKVAAQLDKLGQRDPRWRFLHSLPVGERDADIDHLVVGPGGVFTLNAKHHRDKTVVVQGEAVYVDGFRQPYVRNSRHEAQRASRLLSAAVGFPVAVCGVVVPVNAKDFVVKSQPKDVVVVNRRRIGQWLEATYPVLSPPAVSAVYEAARRSTTWTARWGS